MIITQVFVGILLLGSVVYFGIYIITKKPSCPKGNVLAEFSNPYDDDIYISSEELHESLKKFF